MCPGPVSQMRSFALVIGFALSFGALFSKTWRIHIIFANKQMKRKVSATGPFMLNAPCVFFGSLLVRADTPENNLWTGVAACMEREVIHYGAGLINVTTATLTGGGGGGW